MTILARETQLDTLTGVVDGTNQTFQTSHAIGAYVGVYVNGALKVASLDDGYVVVDTRTVRLKLAPKPGDTLEIEYEAANVSGGGADGGVPTPPQITVLAPVIVLTRNIKPAII